MIHDNEYFFARSGDQHGIQITVQNHITLHGIFHGRARFMRLACAHASLLEAPGNGRRATGIGQRAPGLHTKITQLASVQRRKMGLIPSPEYGPLFRDLLIVT